MAKIFTMNKTSADSTSATINILSQIGNSWFEDGVIAKEFAEELKALGNVTDIMVNISSPGGSVIEGMAMYHMLKDHPAKVTTNNVGTVASIASVIFMAGDVRISPASSLFLAHKPMGGDAMLNADEHRKVAEALDMHEQVISTVYAAATDMSADELADFLREEKYISGTDALAMGFATEAGTDLKAAASIDDAKMAAHAIELQSQNEAKDVEITALRALTQENVASYEAEMLKSGEIKVELDALKASAVVTPMDAVAVIDACKTAECEFIATALIAAGSPEKRVTDAIASVEKIRDVCVAAEIPDSAAIVAKFDDPAALVKAVVDAFDDDREIQSGHQQNGSTKKPFNAVTTMANFSKGK